MNYNVSNLKLSIDQNYLLLNIQETLEEGDKGPETREIISFYPTRSTSFRYNYILATDPKGGEFWNISTIELINSDSGSRYFIKGSDLISGKIKDTEGAAFNILTLQAFLIKSTNI